MAEPRDAVVSLAVRVERNQPSLPRYVVVPAATIARWDLTATTLLDVTLDGRAADALPPELAALIARDASARKALQALTASRQRMVREHVAQARRTDTRAARARRALRGSLEPARSTQPGRKRTRSR